MSRALAEAGQTPPLPTTLAELLAAKPGGEGVRVAVIDTGVDQESLLRRTDGRLRVEGAVFGTGPKEVRPYAGQQSAPHGTAVAGILLRHAPAIALVSADVFGSQGRCEVETLLRAVEWCVHEANCRVLNLSLGVTEDRLLPVQRRWHLQRVMEECYHRDVVVVAAAHNDHPASRSFPAVLGPPLIGVTKGPWHDDLVLRYQPQERVEFQATASASGDFLTQTPASSWAAPHVTALVARLLSLRPGLKPFEVKSILYRLGT